MIKTKIIDVNGKKIRISQLNAIEGRKVMLRYGESLKTFESGENEEIMKMLLAHSEIEIAPDKWVKFDNDDMINQHLNFKELLQVENEVWAFTSDFSQGEQK